MCAVRPAPRQGLVTFVDSADRMFPCFHVSMLPLGAGGGRSCAHTCTHIIPGTYSARLCRIVRYHTYDGSFYFLFFAFISLSCVRLAQGARERFCSSGTPRDGGGPADPFREARSLRQSQGRHEIQVAPPPPSPPHPPRLSVPSPVYVLSCLSAPSIGRYRGGRDNSSIIIIVPYTDGLKLGNNQGIAPVCSRVLGKVAYAMEPW